MIPGGSNSPPMNNPEGIQDPDLDQNDSEEDRGGQDRQERRRCCEAQSLFIRTVREEENREKAGNSRRETRIRTNETQETEPATEPKA